MKAAFQGEGEEVNQIVEVEQMPYEEKYRFVFDYMNMLRGFVLPFVEKELGAKKVAELKAIWESETRPIPDSATPEEKFEVAYGNWTRNWEAAYQFVQTNLGENGIEEFKRTGERANVEELKRRAGGPALFMLRLMRAVSPSAAFRTLAKQLSYQLQGFTPFTVSELSGERVVLEARPCKVADSTSGGAACTVGCQQIYPQALEPFGVHLSLKPQGRDCTITLTRA